MPDVEIDRPDLAEIRAALAVRLGTSIIEVSYAHKELSFRIRKEDLLEVIGFLKLEQGFNALNDMIGLDSGRGPGFAVLNREADEGGLGPGVQVRSTRPEIQTPGEWRAEGSSPDHPAPLGEGRKRFSVLYQLYRFPGFQRVRLAVDLDDGETVDSIVPLFRSADWAEREIFDMFGVDFAGHPDLRRVYLPEEFDGHPLRKDFPLGGKTGGV